MAAIQLVLAQSHVECVHQAEGLLLFFHVDAGKQLTVVAKVVPAIVD